jgi:signal transduction histidine kinase
MEKTTLLNTLVILESIVLLVISYILFFKLKDLSRLKKIQEEFNNLKSSKNSARNDFLPILVHELRSPLSVIRGAADLLIKSTDELSVAQIQTLLNQIKSSSSTLLTMVGSILDVSKMENGKFEINKTYGDINSVLKEECSYFDPLTKIKKLSIQCTVDENIPNFSFDTERIKQVLSNLISNAIKFSPEGSVITICSRKIGSDCRVEVSDLGVGIPENEKASLFQKFFQASNQDGVQKGTGLGLYISKGIVEAHGGSIWFENNIPQGSKFCFSIPIKS